MPIDCTVRNKIGGGDVSPSPDTQHKWSKNMKNALKILKDARELIALPEAWTQCTQARDVDGHECRALDQRAVRFCADGALIKASYGMDNANYWDAFGLLQDEVCEIDDNMEVTYFNDHHTHDQVLDVLDNAIAMAKSETVS